MKNAFADISAMVTKPRVSQIREPFIAIDVNLHKSLETLIPSTHFLKKKSSKSAMKTDTCLYTVCLYVYLVLGQLTGKVYTSVMYKFCVTSRGGHRLIF